MRGYLVVWAACWLAGCGWTQPGEDEPVETGPVRDGEACVVGRPCAGECWLGKCVASRCVNGADSCREGYGCSARQESCNIFFCNSYGQECLPRCLLTEGCDFGYECLADGSLNGGLCHPSDKPLLTLPSGRQETVSGVPLKLRVTLRTPGTLSSVSWFYNYIDDERRAQSWRKQQSPEELEVVDAKGPDGVPIYASEIEVTFNSFQTAYSINVEARSDTGTARQESIPVYMCKPAGKDCSPRTYPQCCSGLTCVLPSNGSTVGTCQ